MKIRKVVLAFLLTVALALAGAWFFLLLNKQAMVQAIEDQLSQSLDGSIEIGDADLAWWATFPDFSLRLQQLSLRNRHQQEVFAASQLYVAVSLRALLQGEIDFRSALVEQAALRVWRTRAGMLNVQQLARRDSAGVGNGAAFITLTRGLVELRQVEVVYHDSLRNKTVALQLQQAKLHAQRTDSLWRHVLDGQVLVHELTFNASQGSFLKKTPLALRAHVRKVVGSKALFFDSCEVQLPQSRLLVNGSVHTPRPGWLRLHIASEALHYDEALRVLPEQLAQKLRPLHVHHPIQYQVSIAAPLGVATDPQLHMQFALRDNEAAYGTMQLEQLALQGTFTNQADTTQAAGNANTEIVLNSVAGHLYRLPFTAQVRLQDLNELRLALDFRQQLDLPSLNPLLDTTQVRLTAGKLQSQFRYEGNLSEYLNSSLTEYQGHLRGSLEIAQSGVHWLPRQLRFDPVALRVRFNEDTVWLDELSARTGDNALTLAGRVVNYVPFFLVPSEHAAVQLKVQSPSLDLSKLLMKRTGKRPSGRQQRENRQRLAELLNELFTTVDIELQLDVAKIKKGSFAASNLTGLLRVGKGRLEANRMQMNFAGGSLDASFLMKDLPAAIHPIYLTARTENVDVSQLFRAFDNFGQGKITHRHLEGKVSTRAQLGARVTEDFEFVPGSFWGPVRTTLKQGAIVELPAFQQLSNFLLKRRDFHRVHFAQVDGNFYVKGHDIEIERMEIQSNVLGLFLEGVYSLKRNTDLSIQIPLSNLKKRDKTFRPERVGTHAKAGPSVFLHARDNPQGQTEIKYDPFHRFKKKSRP